MALQQSMTPTLSCQEKKKLLDEEVQVLLNQIIALQKWVHFLFYSLIFDYIISTKIYNNSNSLEVDFYILSLELHFLDFYLFVSLKRFIC